MIAFLQVNRVSHAQKRSLVVNLNPVTTLRKGAGRGMGPVESAVSGRRWNLTDRKEHDLFFTAEIAEGRGNATGSVRGLKGPAKIQVTREKRPVDVGRGRGGPERPHDRKDPMKGGVHVKSFESPLLTIAQAARYLNCSVSTMRRMIAAGRLPVCRLMADAPRLRREDLDRLIAGATATAGEGEL
jgi:excisionase family DNA binding protein